MLFSQTSSIASRPCITKQQHGQHRASSCSSAARQQQSRQLAVTAPSATANGSQAPTVPLKDVLELLVDKVDLSEQQARSAMASILHDFSPEQAAAFLVLLRAKGETPAEVSGLAKAMMDCVIPVHLPAGQGTVDIVGTGGDGIGSVNISTGACIIAAAAGARVAKHGNRSVSSLCGSADVLEALGVSIGLGPEGVARCIEDAGVGFMFAPRYHPAMARVRPVRSALKIRTVFNMLGPLLNPADVQYGLVGTYSPSVSPLMAEALRLLGMKHALVVHSCGLDELTPMGPADVVEVSAGSSSLKRYTLDPKDLGIPRCEVADLAGGDAALNAQILRDVFGGARGAVADALNLNAGYALAASQVAADPKEGVAMAQEAQRAGKAAHVLAKWVAVSNEAELQEQTQQQAATVAAA